jgi:site-specific recombinase XerD
MTKHLDNHELITDWVRHLRRRECSPTTIYAFRLRLVTLGEYAGRPMAEITTRQIEHFIDAKQLGPQARYGYISTFGLFYKWAMIHHPKQVTADPTLPIDRPKLRQGLPRPIPDADLGNAVAMAERPVRQWLVLGGWAGLRCMEIAGLRHEDILIDEEMLLVRGKGSTERLVPIHPKVMDMLPRGGRIGPMFTKANDQPYSPADVSRLINAHFRRLGMGWTAHQLRHRFATRVHDASGDLLVTQSLLGHASPTTTAIYAKFSSPRAVEAVRKVA